MRYAIKLYLQYYLACLYAICTLFTLKIARVPKESEDEKEFPAHRTLTRSTLHRAPALWYLCDEISRILRAPRVNQIRLYYLNSSFVLADRTLGLGLGVCYTWGLERLTAVLAHEIGHLKQSIALPIMYHLIPYRKRPLGAHAYQTLSLISEKLADHYAAQVTGPQAIHEAITYWVLYEIVRKNYFNQVHKYPSIHKWFDMCMITYTEQIWKQYDHLVANELPNGTHPTILERQSSLKRYIHLHNSTPSPIVSEKLLKQELVLLEQQIRKK